jgi:hypothetical protein
MVSVRLILSDGQDTQVGVYKCEQEPMVGDELIVPGQFGWVKYLVKSRRLYAAPTDSVLTLFVMRRG